MMHTILAKMLGKQPRYTYRNAVTGEYCTRLYALTHPKTTVRERVG